MVPGELNRHSLFTKMVKRSEIGVGFRKQDGGGGGGQILPEQSSSRHKVPLRRNLMMIITMRMKLTKS